MQGDPELKFGSQNEIMEVNVQPSLNYFIFSIFLLVVDLFFHLKAHKFQR
jgi:hypothetical protein